MRDDYIAAKAAGLRTPYPWRHQEILGALNAETLKKCAYCEGVIGDVAPEHVEHILPRAHRPELVVEWENLTIACPKCNMHKGDYYSAAAPLLEPYRHEPAQHFTFHGPVIQARLGDVTARRTIDKLHLKRPALVLERSKRIDALHAHIERWAKEDDPDAKQIYAEVVEREISVEVEYTATLTAYAVSQGFPVIVAQQSCDPLTGCIAA